MMPNTKYTVKQIGWVYRSNGRYVGITGVITGLDYQDVCSQIVNAARRDADLDIIDETTGRRVSVGLFKTV